MSGYYILVNGVNTDLDLVYEKRVPAITSGLVETGFKTADSLDLVYRYKTKTKNQNSNSGFQSKTNQDISELCEWGAYTPFSTRNYTVSASSILYNIGGNYKNVQIVGTNINSGAVTTNPYTTNITNLSGNTSYSFNITASNAFGKSVTDTDTVVTLPSVSVNLGRASGSVDGTVIQKFNITGNYSTLSWFIRNAAGIISSQGVITNQNTTLEIVVTDSNYISFTPFNSINNTGIGFTKNIKFGTVANPSTILEQAFSAKLFMIGGGGSGGSGGDKFQNGYGGGGGGGGSGAYYLRDFFFNGTENTVNFITYNVGAGGLGVSGAGAATGGNPSNGNTGNSGRASSIGIGDNLYSARGGSGGIGGDSGGANGAGGEGGLLVFRGFGYGYYPGSTDGQNGNDGNAVTGSSIGAFGGKLNRSFYISENDTIASISGNNGDGSDGGLGSSGGGSGATSSATSGYVKLFMKYVYFA